jgi:hypothetical protein
MQKAFFFTILARASVFCFVDWLFFHRPSFDKKAIRTLGFRTISFFQERKEAFLKNKPAELFHSNFIRLSCS